MPGSGRNIFVRGNRNNRRILLQMLRLTLIRHAKSSWDEPSLKDFDRPLNARGQSDAPLMGKILKQRLPPIDLMLSSPALRAHTTARILAEKLGYPESDIRMDKSLYGASRQALLKCITAVDSRYRHVVLVAHNPGLEDLGNFLGGDIDHMPTCAALTLEFPLDDWRAVDRAGGTMVSFEFPKKHR